MIRYALLIAVLLTTLVTFGQNNNNPDNELSPKAVVGGFASGDSISKSAFAAQAGIGVYWLTPHRSGTISAATATKYRYEVTAFHMNIIRDGATVFSSSNNGNAFNATIRSFLNTIEPADIIVISGIKAVMGEVESKNEMVELVLKPLLYIIN